MSRPHAKEELDNVLVTSDIPPLRRQELDALNAVEVEPNTPARHVPIPEGKAARCHHCKTIRQKCTFSEGEIACDRCRRGNRTCEIVGFVRQRTKVSRGGTSKETTGVTRPDSPRSMALNDQHHTRQLLEPMSADDDESSSGSDTDMSDIPAVLPQISRPPPPKRKRTSDHHHQPDSATTVSELQETMRQMETEYKEVIKSLEAKNAALQLKYEKVVDELANTNKALGHRMDDVLKLVNSNERRVDDFLDIIKKLR